MELKLITERELCRILGAWMLDNSRTQFIPAGLEREDFLDSFRLPAADYIHTQTCLDADGNPITTLKAAVTLSDWQTRGGKACAVFEYYKVIKTYTCPPGAEPQVLGYIVV